jgi:GntR family transcriptional regulator
MSPGTSRKVDNGLPPADGGVDREAGTPLWLQLRLLIKRQIEDGMLPPGQQLPSEAELCERFSVSRTVVREALGRLVADGRIYKIKGKGAFVAKPKGDEEFVGTTIGFWEEMSGKGSQVQTHVLEQDLAAPGDRERTALRLDEDHAVVRLRRLYVVDGTPTILVSTALPAALTPGLERANLHNRSLYETIRQRYGLVPFRAERWIEAALPDRQEAALLGVPESAPVLGIESIAWLQSGLPMEYYYALHRTDQTRLHVMSR